MDRWTAFVAIHHLKLRLQYLQRHPEFLENMATPKLQGLAKAMAMLEHDMEHGASKLLSRIEDVGNRGKAAMDKSHAKLDGIGNQVAEVESFVTALEGANGGDPLDDSSGDSAASQPPSAAGAITPTPSQPSTEHVNRWP